jgi:hypothetical protein
MQRIVFLFCFAALFAAQPVRTKSAPLPEVEGPVIEYPSVAAAQESLSARSDVVISYENRWQIIVDEKTRTIWSFSPADYPAYPAVVKRQVVPAAKGSTMIMSIACEASKAACDNLVIEFQRLNGGVFPGQP